MRFYLIFLLLPLKLFSQDISGVWVGTFYNDSSRKNVPYEIAISENKGKLTGYSHTIFIGDDNMQETGVKTIKIKKKGDKIFIEDDELIYDNYKERPPKGVRQYSELNITSGPAGEYLVGAFNTNRTKEYASVTGTVNLKKKEKINETKIIPKLDELKLTASLSFIQTKKEKDIAVNISVAKKDTWISSPPKQQKDVATLLPKAQPVKKDDEKDAVIAVNENSIDYKVDVIETNNDIDKKTKPEKIKTSDIPVKKTDISFQLTKQKVKAPEMKRPTFAQPKNEDVAASSDAQKSQQPAQQKEKIIAATSPQINTNPVFINQSPNKEIAVSQPPIKKVENNPAPKEKPVVSSMQQINNSSAINNQPAKKEISVSQLPIKKAENNSFTKEKSNEQASAFGSQPVQKSAPLSGPIVSSEELAKRKIETIRTVDFKSDSLTLTLYDNGVVDGDTVSVLLNGKIIMPKEGLSTKAITKTIYITPDLGDSLQLIMYAENLGSIPPNTGLLIIKDGEESYQIRFAGDLQKNSAIVLRRNKSIANSR